MALVGCGGVGTGTVRRVSRTGQVRSGMDWLGTVGGGMSRRALVRIGLVFSWSNFRRL